MKDILVIGGGKIGSVVAELLVDTMAHNLGLHECEECFALFVDSVILVDRGACVLCPDGSLVIWGHYRGLNLHGKWKARPDISTKTAEAFEVCEYGTQPSKKELLVIFPFFAGK